MKITESPEKIYVRVKHDKMLKEWNNTLHGVNDIEYIRTDAFIEKDSKYIANHFLVPGMDAEINNFVNYIKEE